MCDKLLNKSEIFKYLITLNADNPVDYNGDINIICERNLAATEEEFQFVESLELQALKQFNSEDTVLWKYVKLNFDYLFKLGQVLKDDSLENALSVRESKEIKNIFRNIIGIGISSNLLPNLPYYSKLPSDDQTVQTVDVFTRYQRLAATSYGIFACLKDHILRTTILPYYLKWFLIALYQLIHCPVKQPTDVPDKDGFTMTQDVYNTLIRNRDVFKTMLEDLSKSVHTVTYVRETMMLIGSKNSASLWLKRAVSSTLTQIIRRPKGVEHVAWAMLDAAGIDDSDDSTKSWKTLDIIGKITLESRKLPDFQDNICRQINNLLIVRSNTGNCVKPFERLFTLCTSLLFQKDFLLCQEVFIRPLLKPLDCFAKNEREFSDGENVNESVSQTIRILKALLIEQSFKIPLIETHVLDSVINVVFRIYTVTFNSSDFQTLNSDIKVVLLRFLQRLNTDEKFTVFDVFLFDFQHKNYEKMRNDVEIVVEGNELIVKCCKFSCGLRASHKADALIYLMQEDEHTTTLLFAYLINCLCNTEKYFDENLTKTDLLHLEDEVVLDEVSDRKMIVYKLLSTLSENANVQEHINQNPSVLVPYIKTILLKSIDNEAHRTENPDSESFQTLFLIIMLLQVLIENMSNSNKNQYEVLLEPLQTIMRECNNTEMNSLIQGMLSKFSEVTSATGFTNKTHKTEVEKALDDICDPLLPARGHGLMTLTKLIEKKDKDALERKQYILNIFQQNLKNEDSFIYLSAIGGLASMADVFPDTVIKVLAEEYSEFSRSDSNGDHEVRMKIGEVLVRVVKGLGEMAPSYKSILLNAFLIGTKDDDYLIRASSLSNLGEICRVLGYKLGTIVSEVLVCVHAIITTDKAAEPRRAAVTVIKQLFAGLEKEMIVFLKDEILPLYRTLKNIYYNDADDVMRLQAQLALEQLNKNMRDFIFPNPSISLEKKVVIMSSE